MLLSDLETLWNDVVVPELLSGIEDTLRMCAAGGFAALRSRGRCRGSARRLSPGRGPSMPRPR